MHICYFKWAINLRRLTGGVFRLFNLNWTRRIDTILANKNWFIPDFPQQRCTTIPILTLINSNNVFLFLLLNAKCPFCEDVTPVPQEYFNHLDHMGRRIDLYERPELCCGSYEFVATREYCKDGKLPQPPAFIFMIDVSVNSIRSGLLHILCPFIRDVILPNLPRDAYSNSEKSPVKIGFVTYDKELHFYNLKSSLVSPQMMIVSDVEEVFVPILEGFLVNLE